MTQKNRESLFTFWLSSADVPSIWRIFWQNSNFALKLLSFWFFQQKRHSTEPGHPCGKCTYMTAPIAPPKPEIEIFPPQILRPALFECFVCNVKLKTLSDFKNHFQAQHRVNATSRSQRFTCAFCECQFTKQNLFTHHMVRLHLEDRYSLVKAKASSSSKTRTWSRSWTVESYWDPWEVHWQRRWYWRVCQGQHTGVKF